MVYDELRRLASWRLSRERPGQTLQPTALVHEAWLRLSGSAGAEWQNRQHFFGAAAEAMRRILVEHARRRRQLKRGGAWQRITWNEWAMAPAAPDERILLLNEALEALARVEPVEAEVIKLQFFVGLSHAETASVLGLSERTVKRYALYARTWLYERMIEEMGVPERADSPEGLAGEATNSRGPGDASPAGVA